VTRPRTLTCVFATILCLGGYAKADTSLLEEQGLVVLATHEGDQCLVSGILLDENGVAFVYRGRRVTVHEDAIGVFLGEPDTYFARLQPRGALFQEDQGWSLGLSWLFIGIWMTLGLGCGAAASHIALCKGRSAGFWFFAGVATNVVALVTVMTRPNEASATLPPRLAKVPATSSAIDCPACGSPNHPSAKACTSCSVDLSPDFESEVQRT